MSVREVREAYGARSAEYIDVVGGIESAAAADREAVLAWAREVTGPVVDIGCGPGQWTNYLSGNGVDIEGVDLTPDFIAAARRRYPGDRFRIGRAEDLEAEEASLGGVLSWYSLIHTEPGHIGVALTEFARCLRAGGGLALGFFEGPDLVPFDHAVTTAYYWPLELLSARVEEAGFTVTGTATRTISKTRRHGLILAVRHHD